MKIKKTLRNIRNSLKYLGIATAIGLAPKMTEAGVNGNTRYVHPDNYVETNAFYGLPKDVRGYTFMDLCEGGYFGKTSLDKTIKHGIGPKAQLIHANEPLTQVGMGASGVIPKLPKGTFGKVGVIPLWVDKEGKRVEDKVTVDYFGSLNLPKGLKLSGFGEWNIGTGKGPKWTYGEIDLGRKIGPVHVSYNPALIGDGDAVPRLEHRVSAAVDF